MAYPFAPQPKWSEMVQILGTSQIEVKRLDDHFQAAGETCKGGDYLIREADGRYYCVHIASMDEQVDWDLVRSICDHFGISKKPFGLTIE